MLVIGIIVVACAPYPTGRTTISNTSAAFEHCRWLIQDRLRLRYQEMQEAADDTGQYPECEQHCEHVDHGTPEEETEQPLCHPQHQADDLLGNRHCVTFDAFEVLRH